MDSMPGLTVPIRNRPLSIWISYSPDYVFWGQFTAHHEARTLYWDAMKIGPGAPPIKRTGMAFHLYGVFPNDGWIGLSFGGCSS